MSVVLGNNLRAARKEAGLRQEDLARVVGVTQGALSQFEKGKNAPSNGTYQAIRKELLKILGESRLNYYLPRNFAQPQEGVRLTTAKKGGGEIKVLGRVAAGKPIQPFELKESITVPARMVSHSRKTFALQVQGDSMTGFGIFHGDIIILHEQLEPLNNHIVVAQVGDYEYTLKVWERQGEKVILRPANTDFDEIIITLGKDAVKCIGEYAGLIRFAK